MKQFLLPNTNLEVCTDSVSLHLLPLKDSVHLYCGDRVAIAEFDVHPADTIDSLWVKLAHSEEIQGWIRQRDLIDNFVPTDSISQAIHFFSNTCWLLFISIAILLALILLSRFSFRKPLKAVFFNDIDSLYPTLLCLLSATTATLYQSLQLFRPEVWQWFYFNPTLSPFGLSLLLALFLSGIWLLLITGIASAEEAFRYLPPIQSGVYLLGVGAAAVCCYYFFVLATYYYAGYLFLLLFIVYFLRKAFTPGYKYRCGHCGCKLKRKGKCPKCKAINE